MGYSSEQIASIRPTATSAKWRLEGRLREVKNLGGILMTMLQQLTVAPSQDVVAVIVGALAAMGYSADQIAHIRPIVSYNWKMEGRLRGNR